MQPNPVLRRLGFSDTDRVAIIHADDVGMCQAGLDAFAELWDFGLLSSGAVMVPCPWALKAAEFARAHPQVDLGVHSTLTSEWRYYRWGPISTRDPQSGMIDDEGYFYCREHYVAERADPDCVRVEIEAQVQRAVAMGITPTHMDTHMGSLANLRLLPTYLKVAIAHRLPPMVFRMDVEELTAARQVDEQTARMAAFVFRTLEEMGLPLMDSLASLELDQPENRLEQAKAAFAALKPGVTHFYLHPAKDTPELRQITYLHPWETAPAERLANPDWPARVGDYEILKSEELRRHIRDLGIQVIGYRALQQLMPDPAVFAGLPF
jgi:hypothetical protein